MTQHSDGTRSRAQRRLLARHEAREAEEEERQVSEHDEAEATARALLLAARGLHAAASSFGGPGGAGLLDEAKDATRAAWDAEAAAVVVLRVVHGEQADEEAASLEAELEGGRA